MEDTERDRLVTEMIGRPLERSRLLDEPDLSGEEQSEVAALVEIADLLWLAGRDVPPLEDDPAAAILGLVPDSACSLSSDLLSRARKRSGLSVSDVASKLRVRGWSYQTSDLFRWETRGAGEVSPAVVQALAAILHTSVDGLISAHPASEPQEVVEARRRPVFASLVDRWARAREIPRAVAIAELDTRLLATVHRGQHPNADQLLLSLEALVASVERSASE